MRTRRTLLVTALAGLTGCLSDESDESDGCDYEADVEQFDPAADLPPRYTDAERGLALRAIREGTATAVYGPRPLKRESYVVSDGAYYAVSLTESRRAELPALVVSAEWTPRTTPPADATVYGFETLPSADRAAVRTLVYGGIYREQVHPETALVHSNSPVPYPDGTRTSVLATCDTCWVRWRGRSYELVVHGTGTTTKPVHEFEATRVAADAEGFRDFIAERYLVVLDDVTAPERAVLDAAVAGGFTETGHSPGFEQLWERLSDEPQVPESAGLWYVDYDGGRYGLYLSFACA